MVINGYSIIGELKNNNSGYGKWGFAKKDRIDFFVKEFLQPVYPMDGIELSQEQINRKREICYKFENDKRCFYNVLNRCSTGNVVTVCDFFRAGSKYYVVTEKINATYIEPETIATFTEEQKYLIIKVILYSMGNIHKHGIVHGDIKPDNILLKRTQKGMYTAKLIDFDSSFFEAMPPSDPDDFQGDMVYLAPESFDFIAEEDVLLTRKIDTFALGILFHQYLTGEVPQFDDEKYSYVFEAVHDGAEVIISNKMPEFMHNMIKRMIKRNPEERPELDELFSEFTKNEGYSSVISDNAASQSLVDDEKYTGTLKSTMGGVKSGGANVNQSSDNVYKEAVPPKASSPETTHGDKYFHKADDLL